VWFVILHAFIILTTKKKREDHRRSREQNRIVYVEKPVEKGDDTRNLLQERKREKKI